MSRAATSGRDEGKTVAISVLLADDAPEMRLLLRLALEPEGFQIAGEAEDGVSAVELAESLHPDVVLLDIAMPKMDGLEAARRIRACSPGSRIVMFSGFTEARVAEQVEAVGADAYLEKAVPDEHLIALLRRLVPEPRVPVERRQRDRRTRSRRTAPAVLPLYRVLLDALAEGVVVVRADGTIESTNFAAAELFGRPTSELADRPWRDVGGDLRDEHGDRLPPLDDPLARVLSSGRPVSDVTLALVRPDGTRRWVIANARPLLRQGGVLPYAAMASFVDITERREAVERLTVSEERFRTSVDGLLDPFAVLEAVRDATGRVVDFVYTYANPAACDYARLPYDGLVGTLLTSLLAPETASALLGAFRRTAETGEPIALDGVSYDPHWADAEGHPRLYDVRAYKLGDGLAYTWRDVTDREKAEAALRASEHRFHAALDAVVDGVFLAAPVRDAAGELVDLRIEWANQATDMAGRPVADLVGRLFSDSYPGVSATRMLSVATRVLETGEPVRADHLRYDDVIVGRPVKGWLSFQASRLGDRLLVSWRDVSAREEARQQRDAARRALEQARRTSETLQRAVLPPELPHVEGVQLTARYRPAGAGSTLGGDWYDVVPLAGGTVALVVGDVEGHDVGAAALMGQLRSVVRILLLAGHPPAQAVALADRFLASLPDIERTVTLTVVLLFPAAHVAVIARAGQVPALFARSDGGTVAPDVGAGPPLGVGLPGLWREATLVFPTGGTLLLCTDGLLRRGGLVLTDGLEELRATLPTVLGPDLDADVDRLLAALRVDEADDDVAVLAVRLPGAAAAEHAVRRRLPPTPISVSIARAFTGDLLSAWGLVDDTRDTVLLLASEVLTNACRHADGYVEMRLDVGPRRLRFGVFDDSHRMPALTAVEGTVTAGRGLHLVDELADEWGVEVEEAGKVVWFAVRR